MRVLRRFLLAASYVTCLPVPHDIAADAGTADDGMSSPLAGLAKYLPSVGLLLGVILLLLSAALHLVDSDRLLNGVILACAWVMLTNGIHFDGLMDTADGIFSHQPRERMLEIMSDPRAGNFGIMTGFIVFLLKTAALTSLTGPVLALSLLLTPAWGRFAETVAIGFFDYAKAHGKGKVWHDTMKMPGDILLAVAPIAAATIYIFLTRHWAALVVAATATLAGILLAIWLSNKVGGQTGDTYGAVVEISETATLIAVALATC